MKCTICGKHLEPQGVAVCLDKNEEVMEGREAVYAICCKHVYITVDNNNGIESFGIPDKIFQ